METAKGPPLSLVSSANTGFSPFFLGMNLRTAQRSGYVAWHCASTHCRQPSTST